MSKRKITYKPKKDRQLSPAVRAQRKEDRKAAAKKDTLPESPDSVVVRSESICEPDPTSRPRDPEMLVPMHVDQFLDQTRWISDDPELNYVHFVLTYFRMPAIDKYRGWAFMRQFPLFVTFEGERWRVTGASRFGDIWLSKNYLQDHGYTRRVDFDLSRLTHWNIAP